MSRAASHRVLALVVAAATGCSPLASVPPPNRPLVSPEQCSDSKWPVVGDVYWAVNTGSLALIFLGAAAVEYGRNQDTVVPSWDAKPLTVSKGLLVAGALSIAATVALIRSAQYGTDSANACVRARAELYSRNPGFLVAPPPWMAPPAPPEPPPGPWPSR